MRTHLRILFSVFATLFLPLALWANVLVKGNVKFANGVAVNGYIVHIETDSLSSPNSCRQSHSAFTNPNGQYQDTLFCNTNIPMARVWVSNCDGTVLSKLVTVPTSGIVECNFVICSRPCATSFTSTKSDSIPLAIQYYLQTPVNANDAIVKWKWNFGDGTIDSTHLNPLHVYALPGVYNVCVTIKTASGCASDYCKLVNSDSANTCHPEFGVERVSGTANRFRFNSSPSFSMLGDSIISRTWRFGDGDSLLGNVIIAEHRYAAGGNYNVCLSIKTRLGCEKTICKNILVINNDCHPEFSVEPVQAAATLLQFNSSSSTTLVGDSIISRKWSFGDSTTLTGNLIAPQHQYANPGSYTVCLTTTTQFGCEKTVCKPITIGPITCHADFVHEILPPTSIVGRTVIFHSVTSTTGPQDSILVRKWTFGDGSAEQGNNKNPSHTYAQPGSYTVCLTIISAKGCQNTICKIVVVPVVNTACSAQWQFEVVGSAATTTQVAIRFHSQQSYATAGDSIVSRKWTFGDGLTLSGNITDPLHNYAQAGTYTVCLTITAARGCVDSSCKLVVVPANGFRCQPKFTHTATALSVAFNSSATQIAIGDSILNRIWTFGDGTTLTTNMASPTHLYPRAGVYEVCLRIQTRNGCIETWCKKVAVVTIAGNCVPYFTTEQISSAIRTLRLNSEAAYSQLPGDSIIERNWSFGDGATLGGNIVNPAHQYPVRGTYTVCLKLKTRLGCDTRWCREIMVQGVDSNNTAPVVQIVNLYPVPVTTTLNATIFSRYNNVNSTLAIYDVYGALKWSQNKLLTIGNSNHNIPVSQLASGPYIFKVTTIYGVVSRQFFKLQ